MKKWLIVWAGVLACLLGGCSRLTQEALSPLLGLTWFMSAADVRTALDSLTFDEERRGDSGQTMLDFSDAELFEDNCGLTLCFTGSGLIGLNYHDTDHSRTYRDWQAVLEKHYGLPTEQGSGMASWYDNPVGKDTAVYLFNLEEGVQVSFYADSTTPDKTPEGEEIRIIPTPELRTPIVPVTDDETAAAPQPAAQDEVYSPEAINPPEEAAPYAPGYDPEGEAVPAQEAFSAETAADRSVRVQPSTDTAAVTAVTAATGRRADRADAPAQTRTSAVALQTRPARETTRTVRSTVPALTTAGRSTRPAAETVTQAVETQAVPEETQPPTEPVPEFTFYMDPESARTQMLGYTQRYEYRVGEPGEPWELIMEYGNVPYLRRKCDAVLCFTSLGLVGINYFDLSPSYYDEWIEKLTALYGEPDEVQYDYTAWTADPVGAGTALYVFLLEDGVQISFFADDTGSELS